MRIARDNDGGQQRLNVEWERPNRAKRPNKPNRHCYITHCSLHIKCPSIVLRCLRCHGVGSGTLESLGNREDAEKDFSLNVWWSRDFVVTLQTNFDVL